MLENTGQIFNNKCMSTMSHFIFRREFCLGTVVKIKCCQKLFFKVFDLKRTNFFKLVQDIKNGHTIIHDNNEKSILQSKTLCDKYTRQQVNR